jgi:hypothetical protein
MEAHNAEVFGGEDSSGRPLLCPCELDVPDGFSRIAQTLRVDTNNYA